MGVAYFKVNSITYANKGKDLLRRNGFSAYIERLPNPQKGEGCGYRIKVIGDENMARELLCANRIKLVDGCGEGRF